MGGSPGGVIVKNEINKAIEIIENYEVEGTCVLDQVEELLGLMFLDETKDKLIMLATDHYNALTEDGDCTQLSDSYESDIRDAIEISIEVNI
jgi:hypothetical protein